MATGDGVVRLFIGGLHPKITAAELALRFHSFGEVSNVSLQCAASGECKGFGYIDLKAKEAVQKCVATLNKTQWKGNILRVEIAKPTYRSKLEAEWAEEKRKEEEKEKKRLEQEALAKEPPKRISVWKRGKAGRWLPVLTVRKSNGRLGVLDPSLMKDGIKIFPDDDSGVLPMDQWTWKWPDASESKKPEKGKKRQLVRPPTEDDEVARELRAEKKRLLAILDEVEPTTAGGDEEEQVVAVVEDADVDDNESAAGSVDEVPQQEEEAAEEEELEEEQAVEEYAPEEQQEVEEEQLQEAEGEEVLEEETEDAHDGEDAEYEEGAAAEEHYQEQEDAGNNEEDANENNEEANDNAGGEQDGNSGSEGDENNENNDGAHSSSGEEEPAEEEDADEDQEAEATGEAEEDEEAEAADADEAADAAPAPTAGLNVYWKSLFPEAAPSSGFSLLSTLGVAAPATTTKTISADAEMATPQEEAAPPKAKKAVAPPVKFFSFAYDERARHPAPAASFVSPGPEEAARFWERNRSVITEDYKKKHKNATKRIQKLVKSGKSK